MRRTRPENDSPSADGCRAGTDAAPEPQEHPADAPAPVGVYGDQTAPKSDDPPVSEGRLNALLAERVLTPLLPAGLLPSVG